MPSNNLYETIKNRKQPFLIAEIGVNYYDIAREHGWEVLQAACVMIDEAKKAGADAVKFQSYKAGKLASKNSPAYWDLNEEPSTSQYALFSKYDRFGKKEFSMLANYCKKKNIVFMSTPFDFGAVDYLDALVPLFKISSSDITNIPFISHIARTGKPILLSTGASNMDEIGRAVQAIHAQGNTSICLMHCILSYPVKNRDAHLNMIKDLKVRYPDYLIGYSDHTVPDATMVVLTAAYLYGAHVIEKHFTLNKKLPGNDHYHAMDPGDIRTFIANVRTIQLASGRHSKATVSCERQARKFARRSIVAKKTIRAGETITAGKLDFKRPGTGIPPSELSAVIGKKAKKTIARDELITLLHIRGDSGGRRCE